MMGGFSSIRDNLVGAWQVMLGRAEGLNRLDFSLEGFWRSFAAVILLVPFVVLMLFTDQPFQGGAGVEARPVTGARVTLLGVALLVDWFAFPLVFAVLARPFGLSSRYVPFIVTRNWAAVVINAIMGVVQALVIVGVIPAAAVPFVALAAVVLSLRLFYMVVRISLAVSMGMALPIVLLDYLLSLTIWTVFERFI
jgi:hypothetical protein